MTTRGLARAEQKELLSEATLRAAVRSLEAIEASLGGRSGLVEVLLVCELSADLRYVVGLLCDPVQAGNGLEAVVRSGKVTGAELLRLIREGQLARAHTAASRYVAQHLPGVVEDVMVRAQPYEVECGACQGTGSVVPEPTKDHPNPEPQPCKACKATGTVVKLPDLARQELALELAQLLPKAGGGGISLTVQRQPSQTIVVKGGGGSLEAFQAASDRVLYGDADAGLRGVVDAEVAEVEETTGVPRVAPETVEARHSEGPVPAEPPVVSPLSAAGWRRPPGVRG